MGIRTREAYYDAESDVEDNWENKSIDFYNEYFFAEYEIMEQYKEEFNIDPHNDKTNKRFTKEEQIDRYAKNFMFWLKLYNEAENKEPNTPRFYYIKKKKSEFTIRMYNYFNDEQDTLKQIQQKISELIEELEYEQERRDIYEFINECPYPPYNEVRKLIKGNVAMCAEYGGLNHKWMEKIYNDIFDKNKVKVIGKLINERGGITAMSENFGTFMIIVRNLLKRVQGKTNEELNIIQCNIYNEINTAWDNIGSWRM